MKTKMYFKVSWILCSCMATVALGAIGGKKLTIGDWKKEGGAPYFYATLDAAGYSDWIFYGQSPIHPYPYHELLCGEWGAAIYYDGIPTTIMDPNTGDRQAMWLPQGFEYPDWPTNSTFTAPGICSAWNNPANPAPHNNSGQSVITNGDVEITIYYEVAYPVWSVMSFISESNSISYVYSDQYIFLQTYVIRNIKGQPLTNLEFYQFLHSHGADEYGPYVNSTYCDANFYDPLAYYVPYNPVHRTGNFRYDITQWNGPKGTKNHTDFVSFSSTTEPDWIDHSLYKGHAGRPTAGSHLHVERRRLNGLDRLFGNEVGGTMGWSLGSLDPNETVSLTLAFMFGPLEETEELVLGKADDVQPGQCIQPGSTLTYTISWQNIGTTAAENAVLVDYLPKGVDYDFVVSVNPLVLDPNYNPTDHTYTWPLGTIPAASTGSRQLTVTVNEHAEPGMPMKNRAVLTSSLGQVSALWNTNVCCWDENGLIYVDWEAAGADIGTSWQDAYTDLQKALARAAAGGSDEIWVAEGVYDPGRLAEERFVIPVGVSVYGGFAGYETIRDQRNPQKYKTILTGAADEERNSTVVRMGNNSILDGFTITGAGNTEGLSYCVYGAGVDFTLEQCIVAGSDGYGIRASNGNITIRWCEIKNCVDDGIRHEGSGFVLNIDNCWIMKNLTRGVACQNSTPYIRNSILTESDLSEAGNAGVHIFNPTNTPVLHNCTFAHNRSEGVFFADNGTIGDPNDKDYPDVQNCILWYNNKGGSQIKGFTKQHIYHSCIYDPNDPEGDLTPDVNYNFSANPKFAYLDPNNVHILYNSPCKDTGNPSLSYDDQVDMDRKERVYGMAVDIGAYEIHCEDISNELDFNADGVVNFFEFNSFTLAWLSRDPNDPSLPSDPNLADPNDFTNWNPIWDLNGDYTVGLPDLILFIDETPWLWKACWLDIDQIQMMGSGSGGMLMMSRGFMVPGKLHTVSEPIEQPELSIEGQISQLQDAIAFLEQIWMEDPLIQQEIDAKVWQDFMDAVYQGLIELQIRTVQIK